MRGRPSGRVQRTSWQACLAQSRQYMNEPSRVQDAKRMVVS